MDRSELSELTELTELLRDEPGAPERAGRTVALRVMLVEDDDCDAELTMHQLTQRGLSCAFRRVDTEAALRASLPEFRPHVILSDFQLPGFDGNAALGIARKLAPDVPFIFVSGTIGEERAIDALLHGAADYVLKDNLKRLAPAITRALERAAANLERRLHAERLATMTRALRMLSGINTLIVRIRDQTELLEEACRLAATVGGYSSSVIMVREPGMQILQPIAWAGSDQETTQRLREALARAANHTSGPIAQVLRSGRPYVCNAITDPLATSNISALMAAVGFQAVVGLPLLVDKTVVGVMLLIAAEAWSVSDEELQLLREVSANLSFALQYLHKDSTVRRLSHFDPHTGFAKRDLFCERLERQLQNKSAQDVFGIGVIDIEQLSVINYSFGRHAGDQLLQHFADRLRNCSPNPELLAHLGGGTFAVALEASPGEDVSGLLEERLNSVLIQPFDVEGKQIPVVARWGLAVYPFDAEEAGVLIENAESALRNARATGVRHQLYSAERHTAVVARLALEHKLRGAVSRNQFELHYQPKISFATGRAEGVEALIRWRDPDAGLVSPAAFLPVLEETGLIVEVGEWVVRQALSDLRRWAERGLSQLRVAINVSPLQFRRVNFSERFLSLTQSAVCPLDIEIIEGLLLEDSNAEIRKLHILREAGVRIAIDDFGTGYSSLSRLSELPIDILKIDRSFVSRLPHDPSGLTLVRTIIGLAQAFNMDSIAEGVETREQLDTLREMGCDQLQGYLVSKPVPSDDLAALLLRERSLLPLAT